MAQLLDTTVSGNVTLGLANTTINLTRNDNPVAPDANITSIFCRPVAGRMMPAFIGPFGLDTIIQPALARNQISVWDWVGNSTGASTNLGIAAPTLTGVQITRTVAAARDASTNSANGIIQSAKRGGLTTVSNTAATVANGVSCRSTATYLLGNTAGAGGLTFVTRLSITDSNVASKNAQMFVGMSATAGLIANTQNVAAMTNSFGFVQILGSNYLQVLVANATTANITNTGIICNVANMALWDFAMFAPPNSNGGAIGFQATNMCNTAQTYSTSVGAGGIIGNGNFLPLGNVMLAIQLFRSCNANLQGANCNTGLDLVSVYTEQDL